MPLLSIDQVSKRYDKDYWALHNISLRLETGVWGLIGPNGAGKTTLMRMVASLLMPTKGTIAWNGKDILRQPQVVRCELGFLPQDFAGYPQLTAHEFLRYIGELKGISKATLSRRVDEVLDMVNLSADARRRLRTFSGGMTRRLGIAQSLLNDPRLLILDEPTVGLDPAERVRFRELIASLQGEHLIILSTHIISDVEAMATDLILLQRGQVHWNGTPDALLNDADHAVWEVTLDTATFEQIRSRYQVSQAIRRRHHVETRLVTATRPHPDAVSVEPTLEEAYLYMSSEEQMTQEVAPPSLVDTSTPEF